MGVISINNGRAVYIRNIEGTFVASIQRTPSSLAHGPITRILAQDFATDRN